MHLHISKFHKVCFPYFNDEIVDNFNLTGYESYKLKAMI